MKDQRFSIGEEVIALTNPENELCQPRKKGQKYQVLDVRYCPKCGMQEINITSIITQEEYMICDCGCETATNIYWTDSNLFIRHQDIEETIEECVKTEDYETAHILTQVR